MVYLLDAFVNLGQRRMFERTGVRARAGGQSADIWEMMPASGSNYCASGHSAQGSGA